MQELSLSERLGNLEAERDALRGSLAQGQVGPPLHLRTLITLPLHSLTPQKCLVYCALLLAAHTSHALVYCWHVLNCSWVVYNLFMMSVSMITHIHVMTQVMFVKRHCKAWQQGSMRVLNNASICDW